MKKVSLRFFSLILSLSLLSSMVFSASAAHRGPQFDILDATLSLLSDTDGLADGTLSVEMAPNCPGTQLVGYWADDYGPLFSCTALSAISVTAGINQIEMKSSTIIPSGATRLLLYQQNSRGLSYEYYEIELPEGAAYIQESEPLYSFQVLSDTHIRADWAGDNNFNFKRALDDICRTAQNSSAIIINGDMTDRGLSEEYDILMQTYLETPNLPNLYLAMGNHDYFSSDTFEDAESLFLEAAILPDHTHPDCSYYDFYLNSAHFIFLSPDCTSGLDDGVVWCSDEQLDWLDETLSRDKDSTETYIFLHEAIENTVSGSYPEQEWGSYQDEDALLNLLSKYDNLILFTSHTHWTMNDSDTLYQTDSLSILNTAAICSLWTSEVYPDGEYLAGSQGYYINVYETYIEILGRDFSTGRWIPSAMFLIYSGN